MNTLFISICLISSIFVIECNQDNFNKNHCLTGPMFWCENLRNSAKCNATRHCIDSVWTKQNIASSDICETCIKMITIAREELNSNMTKDELKDVIKGVCHFYSLKIKIIENLCDQYLTEYFDEFIDILYTNMDPNEICKITQLCAQISPCSKCQNFSSSLLKRFQESSIESRNIKLKQTIKKLCMMIFNEDFPNCYEPILNHSENLLDYINENLMNNDLCNLGSMCRSNIFSKKMKNENSDECELCKVLFKNIRDSLIRNTSFEEFKMVVEKICLKIFKNDKLCQQDMEYFFRTIYQALKNDSFIDMFCTIIELCQQNSSIDNITIINNKYELNSKKNTSSFEESDITDRNIDFGDVIPNFVNHPLIRFNEPLTIINIDISNELMLTDQDLSSLSELTNNHQDTSLCNYCKIAVLFIEKLLKDNKSDIKKDFEKFCNLITHKDTEQCKEFIDNKVDIIISMLQKNIKLEDICKEICPSNNITIPKSKKNCLMCLLFIESIKNFLGENNTIKTIETYMQEVCDTFKNNVKKDCDEFVNKYSSILIKKLFNKVNPKETCKEFDLCSMYLLEEPIKKNDNCLACEESVAVLYHLRNDTTFNFSDVTQLNKMCANVRMKFITKCNKLMKMYGKSFVYLILNEKLTPDVVCQRSGLCANNLFKFNYECDQPDYYLANINNAIKCNTLHKYLFN